MKFFIFWYNTLPLAVDGPVCAVDCPGDATDAMATGNCTLSGKMNLHKKINMPLLLMHQCIQYLRWFGHQPLDSKQSV